MRLYVTGIAFVLAGSLVAPGGAVAAEGVLSAKLENDLFIGDDGHYTNGVELTWTFATPPDHWSRRIAAAMPGFLMQEVNGVSYRLAHQIYTPDDIQQGALIEDDRPYVGLFLGGLSVHEERRDEGRRRATDLHLDTGFIGPATGAERVQRNVHRVNGNVTPRGWGNQLRNEPILNATYLRQWWFGHRFDDLEIEHGPSVNAALGNLYTYAGFGYSMRLGKGLERTFGTPAVSPARSGRQYFTRGERFGWYVFASLEGRYMAHNLLLDGNTFKDSHSVERRELVGDALLGFALTWDRWQVSYTNVWRTEEFEGQESNDIFGSLTLARHF